MKGLKGREEERSFFGSVEERLKHSRETCPSASGSFSATVLLRPSKEDGRFSSRPFQPFILHVKD
jgi:hypothetical protein